MGHMLKNTVFRSGSHALGVPIGTSSIGPYSPQNGQTRYNTTTGRLEFYERDKRYSTTDILNYYAKR